MNNDIKVPLPPHFETLDEVWAYLFQLAQQLNLETNDKGVTNNGSNK